MKKEEILSQISSYEILNHYLQRFHNKSKLRQGENISNPFLNSMQATPSFNIFHDMLETKEWRFKDFATDDQGSCFDLVMRLFNLDFSAAKAKICQDFNITPATTVIQSLPASSAPVAKQDNNFSTVPRDFTAQEIDFWKKYGIEADVLDRYRVKALSSFTATSREGKPYTIKADNNMLIFAYDFGTWAKLYKPLDERKYRFQYLGSKPQNFVFGLNQLPEKGDLVLITGGEKDTLSLAARGFHAISLNSETATPNPDLITELKARFSEVAILYDNDETGIRQGREIASAFGLTLVQLPVLPEKGKDISDFFASGGTAADLEKLIGDGVKPPQSANLANLASLASQPADQANTETTRADDDNLLNMPFLPGWIFETLPEILKKGTEVLIDRREKDVFLVGALGILSGCIRKVSGSYNGKTHFGNLYVFIIAPAASGKGALVYAKQLGIKYHKRLLEESENLKKIYQLELAEYKQKIGDKKTSPKDLIPPKEPPFKILFFPGNSSSAMIIQHLKEGDEQGIFCETEADSMGNVLKQDWGGYSDLLRKGYHHEPASYSRKSNKEYIEIVMPKLSVALAGTPGQVEGLIKSAEDGLFSRFLFYTFKSRIDWIDAGPTMGGVNLTKHYNELSDKVLQMIDFLDANGQIEFHLSGDQWTMLNDFGRSAIQHMTALTSEDLASTAKRFGLMLYRIAMVITALRYFENGEADNNFYCSNEDFKTALAIVEVLKDHSVHMFNELPKTGKTLDPALKLLFDALPNRFQRKEAIILAKERFEIPERTADHYLSKMVSKGILSAIRPGYYQKEVYQENQQPGGKKL